MSLKEQFIRDLATDKLLAPSRAKRYVSYTIMTLSGIVSIISLQLGLLHLALIGWGILTLCPIWYLAKAYLYIQSMEDSKK